MKLISIDPGLDGIGVAHWCLDRYRAAERHFLTPLATALLALEGSATLDTDTADALPDRLASIMAQLGQEANRAVPALVYVEEPAISGDYGGQKKRRAAVNSLYMAIGATLGGLALNGYEVRQVRAITEQKETRHLMLEAAAKEAGVTLPRGKRGGKPEDEWDAIWIGAYALSTRVNADLRELTTALPER